MRIKRLFALTVFAGLVMLASCEKEPLQISSALPMQVQPSIFGEDSKAAFKSEDLVDFYLRIKSADAEYSYFEKFTKDVNDNWESPDRLFWKNSTDPVHYSAALFGNHVFTEEEFDNGVALSIAANQSSQARMNATHLLTLKSTETTYNATKNGKLPVTLSHGLAHVNIEFTLSENFYHYGIGVLSNPISGVRIKGSNLGFEFQPLAGTVSVIDGTKADITPLFSSFSRSSEYVKSSKAIYEALLVPQRIAPGELTIVFSISGSEFVWTNQDAITLDSGKVQTLAVSVNGALL